MLLIKERSVMILQSEQWVTPRSLDQVGTVGRRQKSQEWLQGPQQPSPTLSLSAIAVAQGRREGWGLGYGSGGLRHQRKSSHLYRSDSAGSAGRNPGNGRHLGGRPPNSPRPCLTRMMTSGPLQCPAATA